MARHFLQLWQWKHNDPNHYVGDLLVHSAGDQLKRVAVGDAVWIVLLRERQLFTLGRIVADYVCSKAKAARLLGSPDIWEASYHVVARRGQAETARLVDISGLARSLRFASSNPKLPVGFSGQHLQSLRELTPESAEALSKAFFGRRLLSPDPVEIIDTEEVLEPEGKRVLLSHVRAERSRTNRRAVLKGRRKPYKCDACGTSLSDIFGSGFSDCIQVHHLTPIASTPRTPKPSDFALLCANCHVAAHWGRALKPRSVGALKRLRARRP